MVAESFYVSSETGARAPPRRVGGARPPPASPNSPGPGSGGEGGRETRARATPRRALALRVGGARPPPASPGLPQLARPGESGRGGKGDARDPETGARAPRRRSPASPNSPGPGSGGEGERETRARATPRRALALRRVVSARRAPRSSTRQILNFPRLNVGLFCERAICRSECRFDVARPVERQRASSPAMGCPT